MLRIPLTKETRFLVLTALVWAVLGTPRSFAAQSCILTVDPGKSLVIRDLEITENPLSEPLGALGFSTVMSSMFSSSSDLQISLKEWFSQWQLRKIGRYPISPRSPGMMSGLWPRIDNQGDYDWRRAPFRLMAVVYRPDLVTARTPAGEMRLAYNLYRPSTGEPFDFTVIFEFALPNTRTAKKWARAFASLSSLRYEEMKEPLTQIVREVARPQNLLQLRTNDFYLGPEWELREFKLTAEGRFQSVPVAQTPAQIFNETPDNAFIRWAILNRVAILADNYEIPREFLGSSALAPDDAFEWFEAAPFLPKDLAKAISLNTCNGCHTGTTHSRFLHLLPRWDRQESEVSDFLEKDLAKRQESLSKLLCNQRTAS